ncbi:hypothetical protein [Fodinibius sp. SL11]|uniref:hypothetical protein n=1 Tax=Fodinibius sp. SL11 TaxID=3425690 RepID=UPI003F882A19
MHQPPAKLFQQKLREENITPQEFSQLSGMPETEVQGILEGNLPITRLRAYHLAAALDTDVTMWLRDEQENALVSDV